MLDLHVPATAEAPTAAKQSRPSPFRIEPDLDLDSLAAAYAADGRVRIYGLLAEGALELHDYLTRRQDWIHLINTDGGVLELDSAERARMGARRRAEIADAALVRAREAFQYRYEALRVPDDGSAKEGDGLLAAFARLMDSAPMLDLLRAVTGHDELAFTDGQATAYGPGDFLTGHDDDVAGKNRLAAYVYGLTPGWRREWGGLLLFHGAHDRTANGFAPRFNSLDLFRVPQRHSVSQVTGSAPHRRVSITGWLRAGSPD